MDLQDMVRGYEHKVGIRRDPPPQTPPSRCPVELRAHLQDGHPEPEYQIRLCFGEEYPGPPDQPEERLIMAHVSHFPLQQRTTPYPAPLNSLSLLPPVPALPLTCHMTSDLEDLLCENAHGDGLSLHQQS